LRYQTAPFVAHFLGETWIVATTLNFIVGAISHTEGYHWTDIMLAALGDGTLQETTPGSYSVLNIVDASGNKLILKGTFNVVSATVVTGPLTSFEVWSGTQQVMTADFTHVVNIEDAAPTAEDPTENDLLEALLVMFGNEPVTANGSADHDQIFGGMANDTLFGGSGGGDWLTGFAGNDFFDGGSNWDDIRYSREFGTRNVIVNLSETAKTVGAETVQGLHAIDSYGDTDSFQNIEFASGTSLNDYFFGRDDRPDEFPNFVSGAAGDDTFTGGSGPLGVAYDQADIDSGGGTVTVNLSSSTQFGVAAGHAIDTFGDTDTLVNIYNVALSQKNDTVVGGNANEHFWGRGGNDLMTGNRGRDQFEGDDGKDTISGGVGKDTLSGGLHRDTLTGGKDADQFVYFDVVESKSGSTKRDYITDFKHATDRIHLQAIDANTTKNGDQKFALDAMGSKSDDVEKGHIGWYQVDKAGTANDRTILKFNVDNDDTIEMQIELKGLVDLTKGDFVL
jgi:Ca2+-binding RTX toxin-like protein